MRIITTICACVMATTAMAEVPGPLVSTEWLTQNADSVVVLDIRKETMSFMDVGHIPGAILVDYNQLNGTMDVDGVTLKQMVPQADTFSALMQASGVSNDSSIVIASIGSDMNQVTRATRLYWVLKYFGHDDVAILNGGTASWIADGGDLSDDFSDETTGSFVAGPGRDDIIASTDQVAAASQAGDIAIFDARGLDQYIGLRYKQGFVLEAGHIPGAMLASSSIFFSQSGPKMFEDPSKIIAGLAALNTGGEAIAYCNSGQYSSALWFLMHEIAGNDQARLYDGSMHAWTNLGQTVVQSR